MISHIVIYLMGRLWTLSKSTFHIRVSKSYLWLTTRCYQSSKVGLEWFCQHQPDYQTQTKLVKKISKNISQITATLTSETGLFSQYIEKMMITLYCSTVKGKYPNPVLLILFFRISIKTRMMNKYGESNKLSGR